MNPPPAFVPCVYTAQIHKKLPKWIDGFVAFPTGGQTPRIRLMDEDRRVLCESPYDSAQEPPLTLNGAFLVQVLEAQSEPLALQQQGGTATFAAKKRRPGLSKRGPDSGVSASFGDEAVCGAPAFRAVHAAAAAGWAPNGPSPAHTPRPALLPAAAATAAAAGAARASTSLGAGPSAHWGSGARVAAADDDTWWLCGAAPGVASAPHVAGQQQQQQQHAWGGAPQHTLAGPPQQYVQRWSTPTALPRALPPPDPRLLVAAGGPPAQPSPWGSASVAVAAAAAPGAAAGLASVDTAHLRRQLLGRPLVSAAADTSNENLSAGSACGLPAPVVKRVGPWGQQQQQEQQQTSSVAAAPAPQPDFDSRSRASWGAPSVLHARLPAPTSASGAVVPGPSVCLAQLAVGGKQACPQCTGGAAALAPGAVAAGPQLLRASAAVGGGHVGLRAAGGASWQQQQPALCPACFWRRVPLSISYASPAAYTAAMLRALSQEVMHLLGESFARYWRVAAAAAAAATASSAATRLDAGSGGLGSSSSSGGYYGNGLLPAGGSSGILQFQRQCRDAHVPFYACCELVRMVKKQPSGGAGAAGGKGVGRKASSSGREARWGEDDSGSEGASAADDSADAENSRRHRRRKAPKQQQRKRRHASREAAGEEGGGGSDSGEDSEVAEAPVSRTAPSGPSVPPQPPPPPRFFLRFSKSDRERAGSYSRDDVWVVASSPAFGCADVPCSWPLAGLSLPPVAPRGGGGGGGSADFFAPSPAAAPLVWMGRAAFHGPSGNDMIELTPLAPALAAAAAATPFGGRRSAGAAGAHAAVGPPQLLLDAAYAQSMGALPDAYAFGSARSIRVCALRGPALSTEAGALDVVATMHVRPEQFPLLRALAAPGPAQASAVLPAAAGSAAPQHPLDAEACSAAAVALAAEFKLNVEQAAVLNAVAQRLSQGAGGGAPPFVLCHGVFGSGKSHTLVALVLMLSRLLDAAEGRRPAEPLPIAPVAAAAGGDDSEGDRTSSAPPSSNARLQRKPAAAASGKGKKAAPVAPVRSPAHQQPRCRVLIAAATNAAVDRVLLGLRAAAFSDFARVGSARKAAAVILPHFLPYDDNNEARQAALGDMRALAADPTAGAAEKAAVADAVRRLEEDADHVQRLASARVFGVTCAATGFPCLARLGGGFGVVILDEASQLVEQASLLAVARFGARLVVCAGDPQQLPPVVARPPVDAADGAAGAAAAAAQPDLARLSLFVRLSLAGVPTVMLRTQYRCHPVLSQLCSQLFYGGQLVDGVAPWQRGPRIRGLTPLVVYDYSGCGAAAEQHVHSASGSIYNMFEAGVVGRLVAALLSRGQAPGSIGVICLYKAQVWEVQRRLAAAAAATATRGELDGAGAGVQVNTVDSFQGSERAIIIVCCSRTTTGGASAAAPALGPSAPAQRFVDDNARLNVALSRAQHHLLVIGHVRSLAAAPVWAAIVACARGLPGGLRSCTDADLLAAPTAGGAAAAAVTAAAL